MPVGRALLWRRDPEFWRVIRFLVVGGLNTAVGYAIFAALILLGLKTTAAIVIGTMLGVLFNYVSTGGLVFRNRTRGRLPHFAAVYLVQMGLNVAAMSLLQHLGVQPLLGGAMLLPVFAVFSYLAMRFYVFR